MGKKVKPNKLFENVVPTDAVADENKTAIVKDDEIPEKDENIILGVKRMSTADAEKLERYEAMEKSLANAANEKSMLEAKLAEYAEKLNAFKDANDTIAKLNDEIAKLKEKCKKLEDSNANVDVLKKEIKELRNESDGYLMKISELTFENANLTCQLSELEKTMKSNNIASNQQAYVPQQGIQHQVQGRLAKPMKDAYNPYANNGYGTW